MERIGIDTGGTFTDFVWLDENGRVRAHKLLSSPEDPSRAILAGVRSLKVAGDADVVHGSTVATNALLERRGARTALITTAGFADVLVIGRQNRPALYDLVPQKPAPLIPSEWRFEVNERVTAQGEILVPLELESLDGILRQIADNDIESVAICLLFSFLQPFHERMIRKAINEYFSQADGEDNHDAAPIYISLSSEILPEYREYERTATTVVNAYVAPLMSRYLSHLADGLGQRHLSVMQSNGGVINVATAGRVAARTVLSGPAGGVVGASYVAELAGHHDLITFDMGGTSTDVALCPGKLPTTSRGEIAGLPLRLPIIDIHTVGAGGGSLAYVDPGGALHVGPQSAGADPGPACYGNIDPEACCEDENGNQRLIATTTDANLVLGRLDQKQFLGSEMQLDFAAAHAALEQLAQRMKVVSAEEAAWGIIQVANATMERAIRRISVEKGYDPRLFTLVAFGGAGPLHACELAQNLQIPTVLIPTVPGVLSALGMLVAAPTKDYSLTVMKEVQGYGGSLDAWLEESYSGLTERAVGEMMAEGFSADVIQQKRSLDMRYVGQSHELTIPFEEGDLVRAFHRAHEKRFGYHRSEAQVEIVTLRLSVLVSSKVPPIRELMRSSAGVETAMVGTKLVWFRGEKMPATLYDRTKLQLGHQFAGPAVVFQYDTTTVVPPAWQASVDKYGNLILSHLGHAHPDRN